MLVIRPSDESEPSKVREVKMQSGEYYVRISAGPIMNMFSHRIVKLCVCFVTVIAVTSGRSESIPSYAPTSAQSRRHVLEYCSRQCEDKTAKLRLAYVATCEKALNGDIGALYTMFKDESYHDNDTGWVDLWWYLLHAVGDSRFADFVVSSPLAERKEILRHLAPRYVTGPQEEAAFDAYFRKHFPRTDALCNAQFQPEPESSGFDYGPRHLSTALAAQPRFRDVRLHKNLKTGGDACYRLEIVVEEGYRRFKGSHPKTPG